MFGININSTEQVGLIIHGHWNEATGQNEDLYNERIKICKQCPLFTDGPLGYVCDAKKCWDTNKLELVLYPGPSGVICGCGCRMSAALRLPSKKCVLGKW